MEIIAETSFNPSWISNGAGLWIAKSINLAGSVIVESPIKKITVVVPEKLPDF